MKLALIICLFTLSVTSTLAVAEIKEVPEPYVQPLNTLSKLMTKPSNTES